jgi:bacterioferritin-associated ferredoxin
VSEQIDNQAKESPGIDNLADEIMCVCSGTTRGKIYDMVMQGKDFEAISQWTGVNTGCSGCEWDISEFVKALIEQQAAE